ncbi:MAG: Demethylrebeccamycin-D-glucose O-methyltransferase [Syntrophorhabdaceae bacterium PtaU1.Bin034]|nr:MAG: Demethylrebeccamycin-D-glucose O-methyltransferase [Syntrophorhabdaceae bacterium PtaU1.Bin034]
MNPFDPAKYKESEKLAYSRTAQTYEKHGGAVFEMLAVPVIERANLKPGQAVLDVACGIGIPSLVAAARVAPAGTVVGIDITPGMVEQAKARAAGKGLGNVSFQEGDAEDLPFPDEKFDVVLCNMGLIHMPDRGKALKEMRRVLKKGGTVSLSVWSTPDRTAALGITAKIVAELCPSVIVPGTPSWFDLAEKGVLKKAFARAGFTETHIDKVSNFLEIGDGEAYWQMALGISGKVQMLLQSIPPGTAKIIKERAMAGAERFRAGNTIRIPMEEVVAFARKG